MTHRTSLGVKITLPLFCILLGSSITISAKIIYVDDNAVGGNDGTSWSDAYNFLQDALADANTAEKPVEIRIAQGIYTPDWGDGILRGDPNMAFRLIDGVTIKGGFAGIIGIDPDERDIESYETVLSGDLNGDDADIPNPDDLYTEPTRAENSLNIIVADNLNETVTLDGIIITAGKATAIVNWYSHLTLEDCTFTNTRRGMDNYRGSSTLTNCTFERISSYAVDQMSGNLILTGCLFSENSDYSIHNKGKTESILTNCTFQDNRGSAIKNGGAGLTLTDCLFRGNTSSSGTGIVGPSTGDITLSNCVFEGNVSSGFGAGINCKAKNLTLNNCIFKGNVAGRGAGLEVWVNGQFEVENCMFSGNIGGAIYSNSTGLAVISNCIFVGNQGCAIESRSLDLSVQNCTFSANDAVDSASVLYSLHEPIISNSIIWANSSPVIEVEFSESVSINYCNDQDDWFGEGNIGVDPCFVEPGYWDSNGTSEDASDDVWIDGDYHLLSQAGRWDSSSQTWVMDDTTSPCIDAGDPSKPIGDEPFPNGGRINMGAYGGTDQASKSYLSKP